MFNSRHSNLAPGLRAVCLLLCCALLAPQVTLAAALGASPRSEAHGSDRREATAARVGAAVAAGASVGVSATLGNIVDDRDGRLGQGRLGAPTKGVGAPARHALATRERVLRITPAIEKALAAETRAVARGGAETPAKIDAPKDAPKADALKLLAPPAEQVFSHKAAVASAALAPKDVAAEGAKADHVPGITPAAVNPGAAVSPRLEAVSDIANPSPEAARLLDAATPAAVPTTTVVSPAEAKQPARPVITVRDANPVIAPEVAARRAGADLAAAAGARVATPEARAGADEKSTVGVDAEIKNEASAAAEPTTAPAVAAVAPLNDNFAAAQVVSGLPGTTTGTNVGATKETGEPYHAYDYGGASVWYKWTAPATQSVDFTTKGSDFDTTLGVYTGTAVGALTEVASNDEARINDSTSYVTFNATAGKVYYIAVDGYYDGTATSLGSIVLNWNATVWPANDNFASAQTLAATTTGSVTGSTRGATQETGEPYHAYDGGASVWYKWTAPVSGSIEFTTRGSDFDTVMAAYTGTSVSALTEVEANGDENWNAGLHTSRVVFNATAGTVYYIAVDGASLDWGAVKLQWLPGPPVPANNNFAGAQAITGDEGRVTGHNWMTTKEAGEPNHAGQLGGSSVWYRFRAPGNGPVSFDTLGSSIDTLMAVYTGTAVNALTKVVANDDDADAGVWTSRVTFNAVANKTYYIAIDGWDGENGTIVLRTPRTGGRIAFTSDRDGDQEIFTMNRDGSDQRQITANTTADFWPRWSPDGTKIAFMSARDGNNEIYVMNADGTNPVRLTNNAAQDREPTWSPDGTKIAFSTMRDGNYELYVMNAADGAGLFRVTNQASSDTKPHWSPDGGRLVFISNETGNNEIYQVSPYTGGDLWQLTFTTAAEQHPVSSPNGASIAYQRAGSEIYLTDAYGSTVQRLTNNTSVDEMPAWSPAGDQLLFVARRDGNSDVYVMNADGTGQTNITFNLATDSYPDWQPVTATPNTAPTVTLTAPLDATVFAAPASITITATATDVGGAISKVEFYNGTTRLATDTTASYSFAWTNVPAGTYSITAVATDDRGASTTSAVARVTVNPSLSVLLENPTANTSFDTGSKVTLNALATTGNTTTAVAKVDFYYAKAATPTTKTLIGTDTSAPYSVQWNTVSPTALAAGDYLLSATVTNNAATPATATSESVAVKLKAPAPVNPPAAACAATVTANVVAFDQVYTYNRFGAFNPAGMMYALKRDVVPITSGTAAAPGNVQLRPDKRPRPLVLRVNEGDCLQVTFTNWLTATREALSSVNNTNQPDKQPFANPPAEIAFQQNNSTFTRAASMHVNGLEYVNGPSASDGAHVGNNTSSLVNSGGTTTYTWYARKQGQYMIHSMGAPVGGEGDGGQLVLGLFGAVVVEPQGAKWYRSQVTAQQLAAVTTGRNPDNTPKINFEALDASGTPILNMLKGTEIVHTDVNALITGFSENCTNAPPSSTCGQPFREFVVVFHDETKTVQAFPELDAELFHGVRDGFAINYGSGSLGAPLIANRKKLGPAKDCGECKFEDFFLESWANGDPAMVVRHDSYGRAKEVLFPDDPSGVHHSYLGDPVRFRNIHVGPKETHVFHLHAHQWLHEPREDDSTYLDSQTVSPGSGFTYEINYGGSGNRNFTVGDSIFHCHLYPHFAQGMWELWRVHDVFEQGTADRNLPDGEIAGGTPNPAVVPLPNRAMAPMPTETFKGFPFYVEGQAGHRPPQPPLDMEADGGLPRHRIARSEVIDGKDAIHPHLLTDPVAARVISQNTDPNLLAFARELVSAELQLLPQDGTAVERKAMEFHEGKGGVRVTTQYNWPAAGFPSFTPSGASGLFLVNGQQRKPGAPFAEPCAPGTPLRDYRAAYIQFDMTVNRAGWHDRQARITTLEDDALPTRDGTKAPEPFFFRANSNDCIQFKATNLVPHVLNIDDFQIFTPTDTIGQHIHLVKFDVTSSDGAGNGFNYEDGTFSPGEVQERVHANNAFQASAGGTQTLSLVTNPKFGAGPDLDGNGVGDYVGAQTTTQRWWADPLLNNGGQDRTIRTVFTHDHFGPSSHQHHGLYGALVVEPTGSKWETPTGTPMGTRLDGGPTSYAANILTPDAAKSFREFNLAIADFAIVYTKDLKPVNPPGRNEVPLPHIVEPPAIPKPESISADDPGTGLLNYRNEPIPLRVANGTVLHTDARGDMANVFRSKDDAGNTIHGDPFTPLLEAFEGDTVQIRLIQGAQEEQHVFSLHGGKWLHEPSAKNSGWYNAQGLGISEHFEFEVPPLPAVGNVGGANKDVADFMYGSFATDNLWNGMWGILRAYRDTRPGVTIKKLPNNSDGAVTSSDTGLRTDFCPAGATQKQFAVEAWLAKDLVGPDGITYNKRFNLRDPAGIVFVRAEDVAAVKAKTRKLEPLVLRANAGDCVNLQLTNRLPATAEMPDYDSWNLMPMLVPNFNLNQLKPSREVSLHPQLLEYDVRTSDGANVGLNDKQTVSPGASKTYRWYAGKVTVNADGSRTAQAIEYGAVNLTDYGDIMKHGSHGAGAVLVVEPKGATWTFPDATTHTVAEVKSSAGALLFKEFVTVYQDDVKMVGPNVAQGVTILGLAGVNPVRNYVGESDPEDSGMKAFNYRTEPLWARLGFLDEMTKRNRDTFQDVSELMNNVNQAGVFSSAAHGDPETPVFSAAAGTPVRFRVVQPTGHQRQHGFTIYGHNWFHEPWREDSTVIWSPGTPEPTSTTIGTQGGHSARRHWNIVLRHAGGAFKQPGDYMFRTQESYQVTNGLWGIFRVTGTTTSTSADLPPPPTAP